jgi:hypothetical protein
MKHLELFEKYTASQEYKADSRRDIDLEKVRGLNEYKDITDLGFVEDTSFQQELNNTIKFVRKRHKQSQEGFADVFYTIHPSGAIRRYNLPKSDVIPPGSGNLLYKYPKFKNADDYRKGLLFLWQYLKRKENVGNFR